MKNVLYEKDNRTNLQASAAFSQETSAAEIKNDAKHFLSQPWGP